MAQLALSRPAPNALVAPDPAKVSAKAVTPFLNKLYNMVDDASTDPLIKWSDSGDSFLVLDHEKFAHDVLGRWFKHKNFASFVRQLNMYGFHKVPHLQQGVLRNDSETEVINFENPHFKRGHPDLLPLIQRKKQLPTATGVGIDFALLEDSEYDEFGGADKASVRIAADRSNGTGPVVDIKSILAGIAAVKRHQTSISSDLKNLQSSNQHLWAEAIAARERHKRNEDTINRILKFLAGVFGTSAAPNNTNQQEDSGPHRSAAVVPVKTARLMIEDGRAGNHISVPPPTWNSDDDAESLDLPIGIDDTSSINPSDRFTVIETPQAVPDPNTPSNSGITTSDTHAPRVSISDEAPVASTSGQSNSPPTQSQFVNSSSLNPSNVALPPVTADGFTNDAAVSDAIQSMFATEDIQRILNAFSTEDNPFNLPFPIPQNENQPSFRSLTNSPGLPFDSSMISRDTPLSKQIQGVANDTDDLSSRVNEVNTDLDSIIENLRFNPHLQPTTDSFSHSFADPMLSGNLGSSADFDFDTFLAPQSDQYLSSIPNSDLTSQNLGYPPIDVPPSLPSQEEAPNCFDSQTSPPMEDAGATPAPRKKRKSSISDSQGGKKRRK